MPRRKISLQDAIEIVHEHGLVVRQSEPAREQSQVNKPAKKEKVEKTGKYYSDVLLYASHTIGNHGTFGPGLTKVPNELVACLKHQDQLARKADDNFLSKEMKSFVIVERASDGAVSHAAVQVLNDTLKDFDATKLPSIVIRK